MFGRLEGLFGGALKDLLAKLGPVAEQILIAALTAWLSRTLPGLGVTASEIVSGNGLTPEITASLARDIALAARSHQKMFSAMDAKDE